MTYYIYTHHRKTDDSIFYVGKGSGNRAYKKTKRNSHWNNVVSKHGYYVKIVEEFEIEQDSFDAEISLISKIGMENLTNMTAGGEGSSGYAVNLGRKLTKETKEKVGLASKKNWQNPSYISKMKKRRNGIATQFKPRLIKNITTDEVFVGREAAGKSCGVSGAAIDQCINRGLLIKNHLKHKSGGYYWKLVND